MLRFSDPSARLLLIFSQPPPTTVLTRQDSQRILQMTKFAKFTLFRAELGACWSRWMAISSSWDDDGEWKLI